MPAAENAVQKMQSCKRLTVCVNWKCYCTSCRIVQVLNFSMVLLTVCMYGPMWRRKWYWLCALAQPIHWSCG